jgi:hypothetical protein
LTAPGPAGALAPCSASLVWQAECVKVVFDADLWLWDARRAETWTFVSLPASESQEIRDLPGEPGRLRASG